MATMKNILLFLTFFSYMGTVFGDKPCLVLLMGTGSAGKTSVGKSLLSLDKRWKVIDEDDIYIDLFLETIATMFPAQWNSITKA